MNQTILTSIIASIAASVVSVAVTMNLKATPAPVELTPQEHPLVVVDFTNLSQRLMVSMRDKITQSDMEMNQEVIELLAQSEASRLFKEVVKQAPNSVVLNKTSIVNAPDAIDITDKIANAMGLEKVTPEAINEFISGSKVTKPVGVK